MIDNTPKCSDPEVKKLAQEIFIEKMTPGLEEEYFKEQINYSDLSDYAETNGYSYDEVVSKEKERISNDAKIYLNQVKNDVKFQNILTSKIQKDIKRCDCEADIKSKFLKDIKAFYSAQLNDEGNLYVELLYKVNE